MTKNFFDEDLLANLLANVDDNSNSSINECTQIKSSGLKELDYNFINGGNTNITDKSSEKKVNSASESVFYIDEHSNSSDDEDKKYFEKQQYSEYGREIKHLLKSNEPGNININSNLLRNKHFNTFSNTIPIKDKINFIDSQTNMSLLLNDSDISLQKSNQNSLKVVGSSKTVVKKKIDSDPIFGLRIIKPIISSAELVEKMQGRTAVTISSVKLHLMNQSIDNSNDWVIGGVILHKSLTKTSQMGNQYCIWKITDLTAEMKTVSVFLFSNAYKNLWKITNGTVVAILNPSVLESRDDKDLATLSVNNSQSIMVLGYSRDLGKCKSLKKNGEPCTAPVNLSNCEYCLYHIKQEYGKYSRRSDLGSNSLNRIFGNLKNDMKRTSIFQQRHPDALPFLAIPAKRNETLFKKDCDRLALLRGNNAHVHKQETCNIISEAKIKSTTVEFSVDQAKKDLMRLNKLKEWDANTDILNPPPNKEKKVEITFKLPTPKLGNGITGGMIDFSNPISKDLVNRAKLNAIEWVKRNGSILKTNPNKIRPDKELLKKKGLKRKREDKEDEKLSQKNKKNNKISNKFLEMMEMKSIHTDLIQNKEDEQLELYFKKGEFKERMEIKMLETFQMNCKAIYCSICKYLAFSGSDLCKTLQHPLKVVNAVKRFFKCANCENRTISLDRIPATPCKKCSTVKWIKTTMMDEKRTKVTGPKLCIRGGEEKFIGSAVSDANLDLLVTDSA